jgi:hypothetical protein
LIISRFDIEEAKKTPLAPREGRTFYEMDMTDKTILFVEQDDDCARAFTAISNVSIKNKFAR